MVQLPKERWTIKPDAFRGIVKKKTSEAAQLAIRDRTYFKSDQELLEKLHGLLKEKRRLSQLLINLGRGLPTANTYARRFGSLKAAYEAVGFQQMEDCCSKRIKARKSNQRMRRSLLAGIAKLFGDEVSLRRGATGFRRLLYFHGKPISLLICPCDHTKLGRPRWILNVVPSEKHLVTLLCRCSETNNRLKDFYLFPNMDIVDDRASDRIRLKPDDPFLGNGKRLSSLSQLPAIVDSIFAKAEDDSSRS